MDRARWLASGGAITIVAEASRRRVWQTALILWPSWLLLDEFGRALFLMMGMPSIAWSVLNVTGWILVLLAPVVLWFFDLRQHPVARHPTLAAMSPAVMPDGVLKPLLALLRGSAIARTEYTGARILQAWLILIWMITSAMVVLIVLA